MNAKHTETPWITLDLGTDSTEQRIGSRDGTPLAVVVRQPTALEHQPDIDAKFIVTACNIYAANLARIAELESALAEVQLWNDGDIESGEVAADIETLQARAKRIRHALALAKEGGK